MDDDIDDPSGEEGVLEDRAVDEPESNISPTGPTVAAAPTPTWTDVSSDDIITEGRRQRQPRKRNSDDGYHFTNIGDDMDNFLCAQTVYI